MTVAGGERGREEEEEAMVVGFVEAGAEVDELEAALLL